MEKRVTITQASDKLMKCILEDAKEVAEVGNSSIESVVVVLNQAAWRTLALMGHLKCTMGSEKSGYDWRYTVFGMHCYQIADNSDELKYFITVKGKTI